MFCAVQVLVPVQPTWSVSMHARGILGSVWAQQDLGTTRARPSSAERGHWVLGSHACKACSLPLELHFGCPAHSSVLHSSHTEITQCQRTSYCSPVPGHRGRPHSIWEHFHKDILKDVLCHWPTGLFSSQSDWTVASAACLLRKECLFLRWREVTIDLWCILDSPFFFPTDPNLPLPHWGLWGASQLCWFNYTQPN